MKGYAKRRLTWRRVPIASAHGTKWLVAYGDLDEQFLRNNYSKSSPYFQLFRDFSSQQLLSITSNLKQPTKAKDLETLLAQMAV